MIDIGFFGWSLQEFIDCPSWGDAGGLALDTISLLPIIPSVGYITHADDAAKLVGKADDVGKVFKKELKFWDHAEDAMKARGITEDSVREALSKGVGSPGNVPGRTVYDLSASDSLTGRGVRVVVEDATGEIVTVIDKGSNFNP